MGLLIAVALLFAFNAGTAEGVKAGCSKKVEYAQECKTAHK